jgi:outer membrane lipoprotein SlyB
VLLAPLVVPGIGLLLAAGAFAAGGAIGGGLIGMLVEAGHEEDEAQAIASEVKSGKYIVTLHTTDNPFAAEMALRNAGAENVYVSTPRPSATVS